MRQQLVAKLYEILDNHKKKLGYNYLSNPIPEDYICGIYFFFDSITIIKNCQSKITYIGITKDNANNRLARHRNNGPSSFRDHVSEALVNKQGSSNRDEVNIYIHKLQYIFITIEEILELERIEKSAIRLVSNCNKTNLIHIPDKNWLGYYGPSIIPDAHIWNIQYARINERNIDYDNCNSALDKLSHYSNQMMNNSAATNM